MTTGAHRYETLRELFKGKRPSVNLFETLLIPLSCQEKEMYYRYAFFLFMNMYNELSGRYQYFLANLVLQNLQDFLDYLMEISGLPQLQCPVKETEFVIRVFHLLNQNPSNVKVSSDLLAFNVLLSYPIGLRIKTLSKYIRECRFSPETFFELAEYVRIYW